MIDYAKHHRLEVFLLCIGMLLLFLSTFLVSKQQSTSEAYGIGYCCNYKQRYSNPRGCYETQRYYENGSPMDENFPSSDYEFVMKHSPCHYDENGQTTLRLIRGLFTKNNPLTTEECAEACNFTLECGDGQWTFDEACGEPNAPECANGFYCNDCTCVPDIITPPPPPPECILSTDCNDGDACTTDYCVGGSCSFEDNDTCCNDHSECQDVDPSCGLCGSCTERINCSCNTVPIEGAPRFCGLSPPPFSFTTDLSCSSGCDPAGNDCNEPCEICLLETINVPGAGCTFSCQPAPNAEILWPDECGGGASSTSSDSSGPYNSSNQSAVSSENSSNTSDISYSSLQSSSSSLTSTVVSSVISSLLSSISSSIDSLSSMSSDSSSSISSPCPVYSVSSQSLVSSTTTSKQKSSSSSSSSSRSMCACSCSSVSSSCSPSSEDLSSAISSAHSSVSIDPCAPPSSSQSSGTGSSANNNGGGQSSASMCECECDDSPDDGGDGYSSESFASSSTNDSETFSSSFSLSVIHSFSSSISSEQSSSSSYPVCDFCPACISCKRCGFGLTNFCDEAECNELGLCAFESGLLGNTCNPLPEVCDVCDI